MAVISLDFSNTDSWPSTRRLVVAKADTRCSALSPVRRLWVRREVLPSIATKSSLSGQHSATQAKPRRKVGCALPQSRILDLHEVIKQRGKVAGGIRFAVKSKTVLTSPRRPVLTIASHCL